jgi:ABC-type sulfate/molybdate transport systems ATPase subunit
MVFRQSVFAKTIDSDIGIHEKSRRNDNKEFVGCTVLCITHGQDACDWFDMVVAMNRGRIVGVGSYKEPLGSDEVAVFYYLGECLANVESSYKVA